MAVSAIWRQSVKIVGYPIRPGLLASGPLRQTMSIDPSLTIAQFDYELPPDLIAQSPPAQRQGSRLLHLDGASQLHDRQFTDLPSLLRKGDLLVFNDTRVIKARLHGQKSSGGKVEVLIERVTGPDTALAHIRASKSPKPGTLLELADGKVLADCTGREDALFALRFHEPVLDMLEQYGATPLPPYITHAADEEDDSRYQTVYARHPGAVAAPTAGLHFTDDMLSTLREQGVDQAFVTLHVGAGTFQPVRVDNISEHVMHAERYHVPAATLAKIEATRAAGGRVIAVGTTSVRSLESAASKEPGMNQRCADGSIEGDTRLFITPGFQYQWVDALITNFHLPQSTLLMLVSALAGIEPIQRAYQHAVQSRYRFFSYGDAMFIEPATP